MGLNITCIDCGDVWVAEPNSDLERRAVARIAKGYVDALPVGPGDCADCVDYNERLDRRLDQMLGGF